MRVRLAGIAGTLAAIILISGNLPGQTNKTAASPSNSPATKDAAGSRDLSGVWNALPTGYDFSSFTKGDPPMTAWGEEQFKAAKPSQGPRGVLLAQTNDMVYQCFPPGLPYIYLQLYPMEIVQTPKEVIEIFEYDHTVRHIFTDGRQHPADLTPTYYGHSIGHWEGDVLVVDTIGLNGKMWLDRVGHPDSDQMHITERIQRVDEKTLQVDFTFDDPKSYPKPWTARMRFRLHPTWDIMEQVCEDNRAFESFEK